MSGNSVSVSVIIPTRNRCDWLRWCVASVATQRGVAWELIVVDDASTDGTARWLSGLSLPGLRVIRLEERGERSRARNRGLRESRGELVLFLDDDDQLWPDVLRRLAARLAGRPETVAVVGARQAWFTLERFKRREPHPRRFLLRDIRDDILVGWCPTGGQALLRAGLVRRVGGFDPNLEPCEDRDLWHRMAPFGPVAFDPEVAVTYRQHPFQSRTPDRIALHRRISRRAVRAMPRELRRHGLLLGQAHFLLDAAEVDLISGRTLAGTWKALRAVMLTPGAFRSPLIAERTVRWLGGRAIRHYLPPKEAPSAASHLDRSLQSGDSAGLAFHPAAPIIPPGLLIHPIFVQRRGGLGNQLFQHAVAVQLARQGGGGAVYTATDSSLRPDAIQLEGLVGPLPPASWGDRFRFLVPPIGTPWRISRLHGRLPGGVGLGRVIWNEAGELVERLERPWIGGGVLLNGYFQSLDWVEGGLDEVCGQILARRPTAAALSEGVVAVHLRTGDDFQRAGWTLPLSYYEAALDGLDPERESLVWLIGDSRDGQADLARRLERRGWRIGEPTRPAGTKELDDFWSLASARRLVLSCSTFAWWAAVTGDAWWGRQRHAVICPDPWRPAIRKKLRREHWKAQAPESF